MKNLLLIIIAILLIGCRSMQSNESRIFVDSKRLKTSDRCYRCVPKIAPLKTAPKKHKEEEEDE